MQGTSRIALPVITDAVAVALLAMLLTGCGVTPARPRDRIGDFVTNVAASASPDALEPAAAPSLHTVRAMRRAPEA